LTAAPYGGLKSPPARRLRRTYLHLTCSMSLSRLHGTTYTSRFSIVNGLLVVPLVVILFPVGPIVTTPDPSPSLQPHCRAFTTTTGRSAPVLGFGTLASRLSPLGLLPCHPRPGSCSSTQKPVSSSRPLYAGCRSPSHQAPDELVPVVYHAPGFDSIECFSTRLRRVCSRSSSGHPPAPDQTRDFSSDAYHHSS
jgi:hypothetical protein